MLAFKVPSTIDTQTAIPADLVTNYIRLSTATSIKTSHNLHRATLQTIRGKNLSITVKRGESEQFILTLCQISNSRLCEIHLIPFLSNTGKATGHSFTAWTPSPFGVFEQSRTEAARFQ